MKFTLIGFLVGGVMVLMVASCATVPTDPLGPGEVRLLNINFPDYSEVRKNLDMAKIATTVDQPGYGHYPTDFIIGKSPYRKNSKGYTEWNTFSSRAAILVDPRFMGGMENGINESIRKN